MDAHPSPDALTALKRQLREELKAELVVEIRSEVEAQLEAEYGPARQPTQDAPIGRRGLVLGGVGAVAGSVLGTVAMTKPASAATGTMQFGASNNAGGSLTELTSTSSAQTLRVGNTGTGSAMVLQSSTSNVVAQAVSSGTGIALSGHANNGSGVGVSAVNQQDGPALVATSNQGVGVVAASGSGAQIQVFPSSSGAIPAARQFAVGSLFSTSGGELWHCVADGTPGQWRLLSGAQSAGAFVPMTPIRVYDSRWVSVIGVTTGVLTTGTIRSVSVANARNDTGGVVTANAVPSGARALTVNLTIAATVDSGFLSLVPGNVTSSNSSSINWTGSNQINANGLTIPIDAATRTVNAICAGGGATHMILDVTGYFLGR